MIIKENIQKLGLTEMESQCLQALINNLYAEAGFSDVDAKDISNVTKLPIKQVRGVLANLVKKGIVEIDDPGCGFQIIYLKPEWYHLHSEEWVEEISHWYGGNFKQATEIVKQ